MASPTKAPQYKRILLKLSGEALQGKEGFGIDHQVISGIADEIIEAKEMGVQVAIVVGGGNIFRGVKGAAWGMDKAAADYVGMLATIMNCLILQEVLHSKGAETRVQTAIAMPAVVAAPVAAPVVAPVAPATPAWPSPSWTGTTCTGGP